MRFRLFWKMALIALALLVVLVIWFAYHKLAPLVTNLDTVLEVQLRAELSRDVSIESARVVSRNRVVIKGLRIAQGASFDQGTLLAARRVIAEIDLIRVLTGRGTVASNVRSVTVVEPDVLLVRDRNGFWNISDLLARPPVPPEQRFRGAIRVESGRLTVKDYAALLARQPGINTVTSIGGVIAYSPSDAAQVDLTGRGAQGRIGKLTLSGPLGTGNPMLTNLDLTVTEANAGYWLDYFSTMRSWTLHDGVLEGSALIYWIPGGEYTARGTATVADGSITSPHLAIPLRQVAAGVSFVGTAVRLKADARLRGSPVHAEGAIVSGQTLNLRVTSSRMDPLTLQQAIGALPPVPKSKWPTPMTFDALVFGSADNPSVRATASIPQAVVYGLPASGITASGNYSNGVIRISDIRARVVQGTGRFTAVVRLPGGRTTINGTVNGMTLLELPLGADAAFTGITDARFSLEWLHGIRSGTVDARVSSGRVGGFRFSRGTLQASLSGPRTANAVVTAAGGSFENQAVSLMRADLALRGNIITVSRGVIGTARGTIRTSGTVMTSGRLDLAVSGAEVDLKALLGPLGYQQASGIAGFDGRLSGTISSPLLAGVLTARDGRLQRISFDFLSAGMTATRNYALLTDTTIRRQGSEIASSGFIRIARGAPAQIELRAMGQRLNLAELAQLTGLTIEITGGAGIDLRISGRYPKLLAEGTIAVTNATIAGFQVDSARIALRTLDGRTEIDELVATRAEMRLIGSGAIGPMGELNIFLTGENVSLSLLNQVLSPYVLLSGPMDFSGMVSGRLADPRVRGELVSSAPVVNQTPFDRLAADLTWDGTTIALLNASLTREDVLYIIPTFELNTRMESIVLDAGITSARLERLLALLRNSPYLQTPAGEALRNALEPTPAGAAGNINATLILSGPIKDLTGAGTVTGSDIALGATQINSMQLGLAAQRSIFHFSNLDIKSPGANLNASAQFVAGEPTGFTADMRDTDAGALLLLIENMPFLPVFEFGKELITAAQAIPTPASGIMNASADVADIQTGVTGSVSAQIADLALASQEIGAVTASARLAQGTVSIEHLNISGPLGAANIQGNISPDRIASLTGQVRNMSLSLLGPMIGVPELSGRLDINLNVTGPLDEPSLQASLEATNIKARHVSLDSATIPNLVISAGRLTAPQITVTAGGSRILASASLPFSWEAPVIPVNQPMDVHVTAPAQDMAGLRQFLPVVQSASGVLSMDLAVSGTINQTIAGGSLVVQNGTLKVDRFDSDFRNLQIEAVLGDSALQFNRFTGSSSLGGTFTVTGKVEVPSLSHAVFDAALAMDALRLSTDNLSGVYHEKVRTTATGLLNVTESLQAPLIAGRLVVSNAVIEAPPGELPKQGPPGVAGLDPQFDMTLDLASNVRIEKGPLQVTIVGPISIAGSLAQPNIVGTVALTGSLRYPGRTFSLVPGGSAAFVWQSPDPLSIAVDLRAMTRVISQSPFTDRFVRYTIYLDVSGAIDNLIINTSSSPPGLTDQEALALIFRQAEIESLISGVDFQQIVEQQLADTLLGLALPGIFQGIELGPLTLGLEPGLTVPLQAWVSLQLTDQFAIGYLQTLISGTPFNVFEASYALSPQYAFSVQFQQNQEVLYLLQTGRRF